MITKSTITFLTFCAITCISLVPLSDGCWEKFKNSEAIVNASDICYARLKLREEDVPKTLDEWRDIKFDDKCHSQCILGELKELSADKSLSWPAIQKEIEVNAPNNAKEKLVDMIKECYTKFEKQAKPTDCKLMKDFMVCYFLEAEKFC